MKQRLPLLPPAIQVAGAAVLAQLGDVPPNGPVHAKPSAAGVRFDEYLREDHPLLSPREKVIVSRRFALGDEGPGQTHETVGRAVGLSKERVRQVQAAALVKVRTALTPRTSA